MNSLFRLGLGLLVGVFAANGAAVAENLPVMIRVYVEYIEVPHRDLPAVMEGKHAKLGHSLHARLRELTREKKARILESSIVVAHPGQRASTETVMEYIYPSEYEPPGFGFIPPPIPPEGFPPLLRPFLTNSFETRNVGVTLEIEPNLDRRENIIDLRLAPEIVGLQRLDTWHEHVDQWGEAHTLEPIFESKRVSMSVTLIPGKFAFLGVLAPVKGGAIDPTRRVMLFVRADVVKVEEKKVGR